MDGFSFAYHFVTSIHDFAWMSRTGFVFFATMIARKYIICYDSKNEKERRQYGKDTYFTE